MRRQRRQHEEKKGYDTKKITIWAVGILSALAVISVLAYSSNNSNDVKQAKTNIKYNQTQYNYITNHEVENKLAEEASSSVGKTVEEVKNENVIENIAKIEEVEENTTQNISEVEDNIEKQENNATSEVSSQEEKENVSFQSPLDGEIINEFAKDKLIYSNTLKEWVTHNGIDIKAPKTTIVKAAADGKVKSIKNDPRYGLTVVIEHNEGFDSVYSNLLTAEFITVEEEVSKGQTIGTVGNTASFEVADEAHLHFEILKDDEQVDPGMYLK